METAKLHNDEYEKVIISTSVTSKMKQLVFLHANNVAVAVKASERRNKPFTVHDYLMYERIDKQTGTKSKTLLMTVVYNDGQSELLTTSSKSVITTFMDVVDNLEDEDMDLDDIIFSIGVKQSKNGREYNTLEFRII